MFTIPLLPNLYNNVMQTPKQKVDKMGKISSIGVRKRNL